MNSELSGNIGLHAGTSGVALFLAYYDRIILGKKQASQRVMDILEHNIKSIDSGNRQHTICSGISGFGWLCEHLRKMGMLTKEDIEFMDNIDPFLSQVMMANIQQGKYDFLHGALGVAAYFTSCFDKKEVPEYLEKLLAELEKSGIHCENDAIKWESVLNAKTGKKGYNISLSHGISSIAAFLIQLHQLNFNKERVEKLLRHTINFILDQIIYAEGVISYFPSYSKDSGLESPYSRLGWCYGDLGIAHILWQASIVLSNKDLENTALKILLHNCSRRDLQMNFINDAGLCHGSSGVAHIFWNLLQNTGIQEFKEVTDYWFHVTIRMAKYDDGLAGYKVWRKDEDGGPVQSDNFIEGISGIGLFLLSYIKSEETAWDNCLMLS